MFPFQKLCLHDYYHLCQSLEVQAFKVDHSYHGNLLCHPLGMAVHLEPCKNPDGRRLSRITRGTAVPEPLPSPLAVYARGSKTHVTCLLPNAELACVPIYTFRSTTAPIRAAWRIT